MSNKLTQGILAIASILGCSALQAKTNSSAFEYNFMYQRNMLAKAGANNITSAYRLYSLADYQISKNINIENPTLATFARASRVLFFDYPVASYSMIAQHEYFGHGGRLRDVGIKNISYNINIFSGAAMFSSAAYNARTLPKRAAISAGGMESTTLLATNIYNDWFEHGSVSSSDAMLSVQSSYDIIHYIDSTKNDSTANNPGHDVTGYISEINDWNGRNVLTASSLRKKNLVNYLNPFIWYGLYSVGNYIDSGERNWDLPCIDISGAKYLPAMALYLAPWGPEYHLNNFIKDSYGRNYVFTVRYGKTGDKKGSGLGLKIRKIYSNKLFSLDAGAHVWRQPELDATTAALSKERTGWMLSTTLNYAITKDFHANIQAGYKEKGFVPGETISSGALVKASVFVRI
ncbi:MAG: hypothetical protein HOI53_06545 [Francisellaceae bacterium]|jgi:hypothetical protein|nr:hypothetical protein [Francisellaceae bacterium]MBT6207668.1 hypothetical protein [Francisellaceae bacterium]MBT6539709.1 hypothetical protein [Francisellaceae bacterium]